MSNANIKVTEGMVLTSSALQAVHNEILQGRTLDTLPEISENALKTEMEPKVQSLLISSKNSIAELKKEVERMKINIGLFSKNLDLEKRFRKLETINPTERDHVLNAVQTFNEQNNAHILNFYTELTKLEQQYLLQDQKFTQIFNAYCLYVLQQQQTHKQDIKAAIDTMEAQQTVLNTLYAAIGHNHNESYAAIGHDHNESYAVKEHDHNESYAVKEHDHNESYASKEHDHNESYAAIGHNHNAAYAPITHTHNEFKNYRQSVTQHFFREVGGTEAYNFGQAIKLGGSRLESGTSPWSSDYTTYTCPVTGIYEFHFNFIGHGLAWVECWVNSSVAIKHCFYVDSNRDSVHWSLNRSLTAGNTINFKVWIGTLQIHYSTPISTTVTYWPS
jgi:hypothetical protein